MPSPATSSKGVCRAPGSTGVAVYYGMVSLIVLALTVEHWPTVQQRQAGLSTLQVATTLTTTAATSQALMGLWKGLFFSKGTEGRLIAKPVQTLCKSSANVTHTWHAVSRPTASCA